LPDDKYTVTDFDYPQDPSAGPAFDSLILADDLALLYLDRDVKDPQKRDALLTPIPIYTGTPSFSDVRSAALTFIGFGYSDIVPGPIPKPTESGSKRSVSMIINADSRKTFRNKAPGQNTCQGDSGGPALLLKKNSDPIVVGVISAGDALCLDFGNNTRLDAYATWLKDKVK
jgi:secreted trypsin-like serine protease